PPRVRALLDDLRPDVVHVHAGVLSPFAFDGARVALDAGAPASELTRDHVLAVDQLLVGWRGQKWIDLPGHLRAIRRDGLLVVEAP
ncbi:MAG: hypothetical protein ACLGI6_24150, partial [Gammaproteobacteria bacterium]